MVPGFLFEKARNLDILWEFVWISKFDSPSWLYNIWVSSNTSLDRYYRNKSAFFPITIYLVNMVKIAKTYLFVPKSNPFLIFQFAFLIYIQYLVPNCEHKRLEKNWKTQGFFPQIGQVSVSIRIQFYAF